MEISLIHPSRSRPEKSFSTINDWITRSSNKNSIELIISIDEDDPKINEYKTIYSIVKCTVVTNTTNTSVSAINKAAKSSSGRIMVVVSDDTFCPVAWDQRLIKYTEGRNDFVVKVRDGIQPRIITSPILDRAYFQRDGWIYHPRFKHCFADQFFTDLAHKRKRVITKNILFKHNHYSVSKSKKRDAQYERTDATFNEGREIYKELKKEYGL